MNISITKKEYRLLLDMLSVADWIMHAYAIKKEDYHKEHGVLKNKLLSYYKEMGADDLIESSDQLDDCYETNEYEQHILNKFIKPYEDAFFWDNLVDRLAERDLIKFVGAESYSKMDLIERMAKLNELKDRYLNEFKQNGIDNLKTNS